MDTKIFDGEDEIVFSGSYNIYENRLIIKNIFDWNFNFTFKTKTDTMPLKDIDITGHDRDVNIVFSNKIRNNLGSGTTNKMPIVSFDNGNVLLFTIYSSSIGNDGDALSVTVNFYLKRNAQN